MAESFVQVLLLARELKLVRVGLVSVDGTKVDANASKHRSVRYDRAKELVEQLRADIDELMSKAEQADTKGALDSQSLPEELARPGEAGRAARCGVSAPGEPSQGTC